MKPGCEVTMSKENSAFIEFFYLPSCSPDLNPDELLNSTLKGNLGKKPESRRKGELEHNTKAITRSLQKKTRVVQNLFLKESVCDAS